MNLQLLKGGRGLWEHTGSVMSSFLSSGADTPQGTEV